MRHTYICAKLKFDLGKLTGRSHEAAVRPTSQMANYCIEPDSYEPGWCVARPPGSIKSLGKWIWLCVLAVLAGVTVAAEASEPKRILLLHSFGRDFTPWNEYAKIIRTELDRNIHGPLDIYEASLATARFADGNPDVPFVEYLRSLFDKRKLDLVVTIGGPAAAFFQQYRPQISPVTPVLFMGLEQRRVPSLTSNEVALAVMVEFAGVVENILKVLPETSNIVVVVGNSPLEKFWSGQMRAALQPFANRVTFTWFNELSFEDMLEHSTKLPPRSAIFVFELSVDAAGVTHEGGNALDRLHAAANAPVFSYTDIYLGKGIVGGPLIQAQEVGRQAASIAVRILNGETQSNSRIELVRFGTPRFDSREMQRWNISEANLPPGSVIEFRVPTIFEKYKWYIIAVFAVCLIQAAVIAALWLERIYRRRAERAARDFSDRLITAQEDERSRLARELHDDVTQRLAALAIEVGRAQNRGSKADDATMREIRQGLVKLSEDVHALSYRLHPSILDDLGLVEALNAESERFSRLELLPVNVKIDDNFIAPPPQIALCLFRIAQEALRNIGRHAGASQVEVSLHGSDSGFRICIRDNGVGFEPKHPRQRASLGLSSMQQRMYSLGGKLSIESTPGNGTMVLAWVPAREEYHESAARTFG